MKGEYGYLDDAVFIVLSCINHFYLLCQASSVKLKDIRSTPYGVLLYCYFHSHMKLDIRSTLQL